MYLAIDIDDTLCNTTLRWMRLFQEKFGNPENLNAEQLCEKYEIVQYVPYWQTPEATVLIQELVKDDNNRLQLPIIPHAREAISRLQEKVPLLYLTGRTEEHRAKTTLRLENNNFPSLELIMRPNAHNAYTDATTQFSRKAHYLVEHHPHITGIIDNSESLSLQLEKINYLGTHILFGHAPEKEILAKHRIQTRKETEEIIDLFGE